MRATKLAGHVDRSKPCAPLGEREGDRPMSKPPLIRAVKAKPPSTLEIAWRAGENSTVDVSRLIKRFKLYAPLRNAALFKKSEPPRRIVDRLRVTASRAAGRAIRRSATSRHCRIHDGGSASRVT